MGDDVILQRWEFTASESCPVPVLPDGCVDVLVERPMLGPATVRLTRLQSDLHRPQVTSGTYLVGYRLRPGIILDPGILMSLSTDEDDLSEQIRDRIRPIPNLHEVIEALSSEPTLPKALTHLGVSEQSAQRLMRRNHLPAPLFWLQLARVRRAGRRMVHHPAQPLADLAFELGFADQSHLTRSFRRFFAHSPQAFRKNTALSRQLDHAGLATGEQISTQNPLGSDT